MIIRKAAPGDIDGIMKIIADAQRSLRERGIDQWQNGYPSKSIITDDISRGVSYIAASDDGKEIFATFALIEGVEPSYAEIEHGKWLTGYASGDVYVTIHRFAVAKNRGGTGLSDILLQYIIGKYRKSNICGIRVDTHTDNTPMRRLVQKHNFKYCGIIHLADGSPRIAYEKKA